MGKRAARKNRAAAKGNFLMELRDLPFHGSGSSRKYDGAQCRLSSSRTTFGSARTLATQQKSMTFYFGSSADSRHMSVSVIILKNELC
jgi:hypothetical protein